MSTTIKLREFTSTLPDLFNVYRAITGFTVSFPNTLAASDYLLFQVFSTELQKVVLTAGDIDTVVSDINSQAKGIKAFKNLAGDKILIRTVSNSNPSLKTFDCPFLDKVGIDPQQYVERDAFELVGTVIPVSGTFDYSFTDPDGADNDWYYYTRVVGSNEIDPSADFQPSMFDDSLCIITGSLKTLDNKPIAGSAISAKIEVPPRQVATATPTAGKYAVEAMSDINGMVAIPAYRGSLVLLQIDSIGYNEVVIVPDEPFALFEDLQPVNDHKFAENGDPI